MTYCTRVCYVALTLFSCKLKWTFYGYFDIGFEFISQIVGFNENVYHFKRFNAVESVSFRKLNRMTVVIVSNDVRLINCGKKELSKQLGCHTIWPFPCILCVVQFWCRHFFLFSSFQLFKFNSFDWFSCWECVKIVNACTLMSEWVLKHSMQRPCTKCLLKCSQKHSHKRKKNVLQLNIP